MKITVQKMNVEVEGSAHEIREALPSVLGAGEPARAVIGGGEPVAIEAPASGDAPVVIERPAPEAPASVHPAEEIVLPHEKPDQGDAWQPVGGVESPLPRTAFGSWEEIPADRLVWNANRFVAHVTRTPSDPHDLFCGLDLGMPKRGLPLTNTPTVCGNCNRRIEEGARP